MSTSTTRTDTTATAPRLPEDLRLGAVHLTVSDVDRSVAFYQDSLGLQVHSRDAGRAAMGAGKDDLVVLAEDPLARPAGRAAGLYHFAMLFPSRIELARALKRLAVTRTPIEGASDHAVSEAIYLPDPDGNGIELYADRPRSEWPPPSGPGEKVGMTTMALDLQALLALVADEEVPRHAGGGLAMGHVHLHVGDIQKGLGFYRDVIGFELMARMPSAAFVSAGGYHHHLGFNVWRGPGVPPAPAHTAGLESWTVVLPSPEDVAAVRARVEAASLAVEDRDGGFVVRDPWEIPLLITAA